MMPNKNNYAQLFWKARRQITAVSWNCFFLWGPMLKPEFSRWNKRTSSRLFNVKIPIQHWGPTEKTSRQHTLWIRWSFAMHSCEEIPIKKYIHSWICIGHIPFHVPIFKVRRWSVAPYVNCIIPIWMHCKLNQTLVLSKGVYSVLHYLNHNYTLSVTSWL